MTTFTEEEVKTLVEEAFREGHSEGFGAGITAGHALSSNRDRDSDRIADEDWEWSTAKERFAKAEDNDGE